MVELFYNKYMYWALAYTIAMCNNFNFLGHSAGGRGVRISRPGGAAISPRLIRFDKFFCFTSKLVVMHSKPLIFFFVISRITVVVTQKISWLLVG